MTQPPLIGCDGAGDWRKKKVAQLEELDYLSIDPSGEKQINAQKNHLGAAVRAPHHLTWGILNAARFLL